VAQASLAPKYHSGMPLGRTLSENHKISTDHELGIRYDELKLR
jgi:hypothetical protein